MLLMKIFLSMCVCMRLVCLVYSIKKINEIISDSEIELAIKQLKRGKAAGCDHLINELYIYGCDQLLPKLSALHNVVFKSSHFPRL